MRDDYLWDRSGEPDPEIERLESVLGRLGHQPRPLDLPVALPRRHFFHGLAAAAVVLIVLAGGLWLASRPAIDDAEDHPRLVIARPVPYLLSELKLPSSSLPGIIEEAGTGEQAAPVNSPLARRVKNLRKPSVEKESAPVPYVARRGRPNPTDQEIMREGEKAKDQLMLALRFASSKLNLVQRKIRVNKESGPAS
ncbi:MAG TPA: hypothetical protein VE842_06990 [Pyrinomonadaceae bacterium]|jgi:hypothetical protein|nr:hypothetical protein [Pyrinomonadaceae bacterium]